MSILLDGLMILLFLLCVFSGWRRGFVKMFGGLIALVAASLLSSLLCRPIATLVAPRTALAAPVVEMLCSLVLFALIYGLVALVLRPLNLVAKLPLLKQINKVLGLLVGVVSGVLWVLFAMGVAYTLAWLDYIPTLTPSVMEGTWLISRLSELLPAVK